MTTRIVLLILFNPMLSFADIISFSQNNCNVTSSNQNLVECTPQRKKVELEQSLTDTLEITSQDASGDLFTYIMGNNNLIDYKTTPSSSSPFGSSLLIFNNTDNLLINAGGFNGTHGISAGEICRDKMKSEWGSKYQTYYTNKYGVGSNAPCDNEDQKKIYDEEFSCDPGFTESPNGKVSLRFMEYQRQCKGNIVKNVCLKKTYNITCKLQVKGDGCCVYPGHSSIDDMIEGNIPYNLIAFTADKSCDYMSCGGGKNGISLNYLFSNRSSDDANNISFCESNIDTAPMVKPAITLSYSGLDSYTLTGAEASAGVFPAIVARDQNNSLLLVSDYKLFLVNGNEVKITGVTSCFGLSGSAITDILCNFRTTVSPLILKFRAVSKDYAISNIFQVKYNPAPYNVVCTQGTGGWIGSSCTSSNMLDINQRAQRDGGMWGYADTTIPFAYKFNCPVGFLSRAKKNYWFNPGWWPFADEYISLSQSAYNNGSDTAPIESGELIGTYGCTYVPY